MRVKSKQRRKRDERHYRIQTRRIDFLPESAESFNLYSKVIQTAGYKGDFKEGEGRYESFKTSRFIRHGDVKSKEQERAAEEDRKE